MQSPKFPQRVKELNPLFTGAVLKQIWKDKVRTGMRKHPLPDAVDHLDFHLDSGARCKAIETLIISGTYAPGDVKRILVEKAKGLCRQLVIPTVRDALVLQSLSDAMYRDIRGQEPTKQAFFEPDDHSFSNQGGMFPVSDYGSFRAWLNFQEELLKFSQEKDYIVITDIANYYDTIRYEHLRNIISGLDIGVRESVLDMLIYTLSGLLWQPDYMPRVEIGLPQINMDAPRILAHCFLYELDKFLESECGNDFARYMDDLDIGVDSIQQAKRLLKCVDLTLHTRQVRLNSGKTLILRKREAFHHYRVRDNRFINLMERHVERRTKLKLPLTRERAWLVRFVPRAFKQKRFEGGNGDKILKRLIKLSLKIAAELPAPFLYELALRSPTLREPVLRLVSQLPANTRRFRILHRLIRSGYFVDDYAFVALAVALVEIQTPNNAYHRKVIHEIIDDFPDNTYFQKYAKLWICSKFLDHEKILAAIKKYQSEWVGDEWFSRLVGGLYPVFIGTSNESLFRSLILNAGQHAMATYDLHDNVRMTVSGFDKAFDYIKAGNPTKRIGTSHQRLMLAVSALANGTAGVGKRNAILNNLARAWGDQFYSRRASAVSSIALPAPPTGPFPMP